MLLNGKVCILTGGGSGIGEVTAKRFADEGATVIIVDIDEREARRVAREITEKHGTESAHALIADVSSEAQVRDLVATLIGRFGRIDVLFNNAATILPKALE